jgi:hypothetical protein
MNNKMEKTKWNEAMVVSLNLLLQHWQKSISKITKRLVKTFGGLAEIQTAILSKKIQKLNFLIKLARYFPTLVKFIMRPVQLKCVQWLVAQRSYTWWQTVWIKQRPEALILTIT